MKQEEVKKKNNDLKEKAETQEIINNLRNENTSLAAQLKIIEQMSNEKIDQIK